MSEQFHGYTRPELHPPAQPLTPQEIIAADKLAYGKAIGGRKDLDSRSKSKLWNYQARMRMIPGEVLEASDASTAEKIFLSGQGDYDPEPLRTVTYYDLAEGEEIEIPYMDISKPVLPDRRSYRPRDLGRARGLFYDLTQIGLVEEQAGTHRRQIEFGVQVRSVMNKVTADSALFEEVPFLRSVDRGLKLPDPHPDHQIKYRALVRAPEVPVYQS